MSIRDTTWRRPQTITQGGGTPVGPIALSVIDKGWATIPSFLSSIEQWGIYVRKGVLINDNQIAFNPLLCPESTYHIFQQNARCTNK